MFDTLKRLLGLQPRADFWFMDHAIEVGAFIQVQLNEAGRVDFHSWGHQAALVLGYTCGASEHLCAQQRVRRRAGQLSTMVASDLTGMPFVAMDTLVKLQRPLNSDFEFAHRVAWHDWGICREAAPRGLIELLCPA